VAQLIAFHVAVLENRASNAPVPPPPEVAAAALRVPPQLPPAPQVTPAPAASYEMREVTSLCGPGAAVAVAPDGRVWYAAIAQHALAVFAPRSDTFRCWPLPTRNGRPHGIAVDRDGFVFATLTGLPDNKVAMFDPKTELFAEFQLPARPQPFVYPHAILLDGERNPLFTLEYGDAIGRIDRRTGAVQSLPLPTRNARPTGIAIARSGHVLAAQFTGNKVFDYDPKTGKTVEYVHPRAAEDPGLRAVAGDSRGNIWVTEYEFGAIGMVDPRTQRWKSFRAPANGGAARGVAAIAVDARDMVWFAHHGGNYIGRFDPRTESFAVYPHVTAGMNCRALDIGKDNALWCAGSGAPMLMKLVVK
jgi:virginiamycin B lyase